MALSPNYGWSEPDNSSLVKNGAADIRTLGDAIDTSLWNVGFGQAGKNKIINGDFRINQRNFTSTTSVGYCFDRFATNFSIVGGTTASAQTFTTGSAPVAGYESANYFRAVTTSQTGTSNYVQLYQSIEDVRTLAGQTATISFWAKAASGTPKIGIEMVQQFGSGGSPSADVTTIGASAVTLSTSWARYSLTVSVPSISGKTVGTTANTSSLRLTLWLSAGTDFNARTGSIGNQNNTFDIWGVQVEYGSVATPFQTATGTIQQELAACQRYYVRWGGLNVYQNFGQGYADQTTTAIIQVPLPVTMRVVPTSIDFSTLNLSTGGTNTTVTNCTLLGGNSSNQIACAYATVASGLTTNRPYGLTANNSFGGYIGFSAEL